MKKILFLLITALSVFSLISCASAPPDLSNMVANIDPFDLGTTPVGLNGVLFGKLETKDATLTFEPRNNVVVVKFAAQGGVFNLSLKPDARAKIADAIARYNGDFDQHTLQPKAKGRKSLYGTAPSSMTWGIASFIPTTAKALPVLQLGYTFSDGAPYFTIRIPESKNILVTSDSDFATKQSVEIVLHFNRAQAERFIMLMSKENVDKEIAARNVPPELLPEGQKNLNAADAY